MDCPITLPSVCQRETGGVDTFLRKNVKDLLSLQGRTVVVTGGGRGIGLSMAFAIAESGGNVAVIDFNPTPHKHFDRLRNDYGVKVKFYQCVVPAPLTCLSCVNG